MVERVVLTPDFVNAAVPPSRGERWVADIKIKGFGLRLWTTKSGGAKAFGIRVTDRRGRNVRKSFGVEDAVDTYWRFRSRSSSGNYQGFGSYRLGDCLDEAREWARDEIDQLKGRSTLQEEREKQQRRAALRIARMPLQKAANIVLDGMRANGLSQAYTDRLDKLFSLHVPRTLQATPLKKVKPSDVAETLVRANLPPGSTRTLKSFIGHIFKRAGSFEGPLGFLHRDVSKEFWPKWRDLHNVAFPELAHLTSADYRLVFEKLESESKMWQQALCIRLFFEFRAPLSRLMAARWNQLSERCWYPYGADARVRWFKNHERIDDEARDLLERVRRFGHAEFGDSAYWFPSRYGRSFFFLI